MSASHTYRFFQFTLRPAGSIATDLLLAQQWTAADPWHCSTVDPTFWLVQQLRCDSYLLLDQEGPLFFWRGVFKDRSIEMHIQFPPTPGERMERQRLRRRVRAGLLVGLTWLEGMLRKIGIEEIYFESVSPKLIDFCTHHLKFAQEGQRISKRI